MASTPLELAQTMIGTREGQAALTNYLHTGGWNQDPVTRAWCAAFINATLQQSGYGGTGSDLAKSFLDYGQKVELGDIQPGDIGVWNRGDPKGIYGHAGIVQSYDPKTGMVQLVSGNTGRGTNLVGVAPYTAASALGFRRPQKPMSGQSVLAPNVQGPANPGTRQDYTPEQRRNAIASIESQGSGDYAALGRITNRQGDRAYGRYQVMGSNIPAWTKQVLGTEMTPDQFLADPAAQDKVFDAIYGGYVNKYGERGAASMWFTGRPDEPDVTDINKKLTGKGYADKYLAALGKPGSTTAAPGGTTTVATGTPATPDYSEYLKYLKAKDQKSPGEIMGAAIANMGVSPDKVGMGNAPQLPQTAPTVMPAMPTVDPQQAEARRQMLAYAMQRLNQGALF
jgi:uncharacterized protein (TIGR02594 family)